MVAPHFKDGLRRIDTRPDPVRDGAVRARLAALLTDPFAMLAMVWHLPGEPDLTPLMIRLDASHRPLALPAIISPGQELEFRPWRAGTPMERGPHGTRHPVASPGPPVRPDIILVPLVAFDRARNRLGRGGGFYDRTLAAHPQARAIGFAYATAEIACVPTEPHDRRLDLVVTDLESF